MLGYYFRLGFLRLRRNPVLTLLMIVTLAIGVAASMATLTVFRVMSGDPMPHKSDRLMVPIVDPRPADQLQEDERPNLLSHRDAMALLDAGRALRQTALYGVSPAIEPTAPGQRPFFGQGIATTSDFFAMFDVPLVAGSAWTPADDARAARVAVLRQGLADRAFGGEPAIGRTLRLAGHDYQIVGIVAEDWKPLPKFYRLVGSYSYASFEDVFLPLSTALAAEMQVNGQINCWAAEREPGFAGLVAADSCTWLRVWVELADARDADDYRAFLAGYADEQRALGRFHAEQASWLYDLPAWLDERGVVTEDSRVQLWVALGFLLVCLVNATGLLLAKFSARAGDIGVRRALGASRRAIFQQHLVEAASVGVVGALVGLAGTLGLLKLLQTQSDEMARVARMDASMLLVTVAVAVAASVLAGLWPTWRACQIQPALQLKSQ